MFINFTLGAYFIYGNQLIEWSTFWLALNSAFRTLMGDFDFAAMYAISPIPAMVWFWLYMVLFYLIMLNMLLAIVMDTYSEVKGECDDKQAMLDEMEDPHDFSTAISSPPASSRPLELPNQLNQTNDNGAPNAEQLTRLAAAFPLEKLFGIATSCEQMMSEVNDHLAGLEMLQHARAESAQTATQLLRAGAGWREEVTYGGDL